jgi:hypothetical protein
MATRSHSNTSGLTPWVGTMVHCATTRTRKIKTAMVFIEDCLVEFLLTLGEICLQVGEYIVYTQLAHGKKCEGRWYHGCYFVKGNCLLAKQGVSYNTRECPWRGCLLQSFVRHSRCWTVCLEHSIHCLWSNFFLTSSLIKGFQCLWSNCFVPSAKHKYK